MPTLMPRYIVLMRAAYAFDACLRAICRRLPTRHADASSGAPPRRRASMPRDMIRVAASMLIALMRAAR